MNLIINLDIDVLILHYTNMSCQCVYPDGMSPRGRMVFPRAEPEGKPSSRGRHSFRIHTLAWHICFIISNKPQFGKISMKTPMTACTGSSGAVEKSVCYDVKVTDDWWFTHSPLGVASDNGGHYADRWTWWLPTVKSANHGLRSSTEVW